MGCLLCGSGQLDRISLNRSFGVDILECSGCGFVQSEYVSEAALREYYNRYYRVLLTPDIMETLRHKSRAQAQAQLTYIETLLPEEKFVAALDYGGADGELAKALLAKARSVYVSEVDPRYAEVLKREKEFVFLEPEELKAPAFAGFFDLISLSHVLEHLPNPISALDEFSRLLKKDGYMFIDLPNEVEMLKRVDFQAKGHIHYFTKESFRCMVSVHGKFEILEIRTCNHSVEEYIASGFRMPEQHFRHDTPNGTVIRALLRNSRPECRSEAKFKNVFNTSDLLDHYSRRILVMHHEIEALRKEKNKFEKNCKEQIVEQENRIEELKNLTGSRGERLLNSSSPALPPEGLDRLVTFIQKIKSDVYPEPPSETHRHITRQMLERLLLKYPLAGTTRVLDIGCGQGLALEMFEERGLAVTGITLDDEDLSTCRLKGHTVLRKDQSFLEFDDESFDLIWCRHCLEHSIMPYFTLSQFYRVLKPSGYIYIEVPAPDTASNHQKNKNHYSVLGKSMWRELIRRTGFQMLETMDISLEVPSGNDMYWAFVQQKPPADRN
ncbi:MAG: methyltransferase domain-containing protein [Desulfobacteraceae bacterium]|nr:MAG: methyltransferase domain-containing protein [Desulfobacteraceae bacterium]